MYVTTVVRTEIASYYPGVTAKVNAKGGMSLCPTKVGGWARTYQIARFVAGWDEPVPVQNYS